MMVGVRVNDSARRVVHLQDPASGPSPTECLAAIPAPKLTPPPPIRAELSHHMTGLSQSEARDGVS